MTALATLVAGVALLLQLLLVLRAMRAPSRHYAHRSLIASAQVSRFTLSNWGWLDLSLDRIDILMDYL